MICDLAETYHILNYRQLPLNTLAVLVVGLRDNSRVKKKINNLVFDTNTRLMVACLDAINLNNWLHTDNASKGINKPKSILSLLENKSDDIRSFDSVDDFEKEKLRLLKKE